MLRPARPQVVAEPAKRSSTSTETAAAPARSNSPGQSSRIGIRAQVAGRRRAALDLGDRSETGLRESSWNLMPPAPVPVKRDQGLEPLAGCSGVDRSRASPTLLRGRSRARPPQSRLPR